MPAKPTEKCLDNKVYDDKVYDSKLYLHKLYCQIGEGTVMRKPEEIVNRDEEWEKLVGYWEDSRAHLILMHGRRRAGKSWLLQRFAQAAGGFYYQATRGTQAEQIRKMARGLAEHFDEPALRHLGGFEDWESLLSYVTDRVGEERFLFIVDEFPYLSEKAPALTSILQSMWDRRWKQGQFKIVLCGSHVTLMKQLEGRDQPLHGRRTARMTISPFIYRDVGDIVAPYDWRAKMLTYGIFGGLPGNLDGIDPGLTLADNVIQLILDPASRLYDEATHLLDSFGKEADVHYSVLQAIGSGAHTWKKITKRVGRSGGALSPVIEWLREMELVEREVPITASNPRKSKVSLYRITDPYLRFWYRFIDPIYSGGYVGMASPQTLWSARIEPHLDDYMGSLFEEICRQFVRTGLALPFSPLRIGRWWTRSSDAEVDIVVRGVDDELFVAECKWGAITHRDLDTLRERAHHIAARLGDVPALYYGLFSGRGQTDEAVQQAVEAENVMYFGPEELFADEGR